jgi:hypothetical protein
MAMEIVHGEAEQVRLAELSWEDGGGNEKTLSENLGKSDARELAAEAKAELERIMRENGQRKWRWRWGCEIAQ